MRILLAAVLFGIGIMLPGAARSQSIETAPPSAPPVTLDGTQRYTLPSSRTRTDYLIDVYRVDSIATPVPSNYKLPVIYLLDGNSLFPLARHIANMIGTFSSRMPSALVVAIGYAADPSMDRAGNIKSQLAVRTRDFTPGPGGAADFLAFINDELKPFVAARYPVDADSQTLAGHSAGGLFTAYTLVTLPTAFSRYVAISPSVFWDGGAVIKQAETLARRFPGVSAQVFVGVGGLETKERMGEDMIGSAQALVSALQAQKTPGLSVAFQLFDDENHLSVVAPALTRGLVNVGALR